MPTPFVAPSSGDTQLSLAASQPPTPTPVKAKHYYLALDAITNFVYFSTSLELRAEARLVSATWEKRRVSCEVEIFTPEGRFAGNMKICYAIVVENKLISITKAHRPEARARDSMAAGRAVAV